MVFRILKITAFMIARMVGFARAGLRGEGARKAFLPPAFVAWANYVLRTFDVILEVNGSENIPKASGKPVVVLANHQSQLDIPALGVGVGDLLGFVAKRELSRIPILAYWMRKIGCVFIDRSNKAEAQRTLSEIAKHPPEHPLIVFPEGTRSKTGSLLPFKLGGARLALMSQALVLPVRIEGTREAFEARKGRRGPFHVTISFHPVLDASSLTQERHGLEQIKEHVESCWRQSESASAVIPAPPFEPEASKPIPSEG